MQVFDKNSKMRRWEKSDRFLKKGSYGVLPVAATMVRLRRCMAQFAASPQYVRGYPASISIGRMHKRSALFRLSAEPLCCGVYGTDFSCLMPRSEHHLAIALVTISVPLSDQNRCVLCLVGVSDELGGLGRGLGAGCEGAD